MLVRNIVEGKKLVIEAERIDYLAKAEACTKVGGREGTSSSISGRSDRDTKAANAYDSHLNGSRKHDS